MTTTAPPHDLTAETNVLGCLVTNPDLVAEALERDLDTKDFYRPAHRAAWQALVDLAASGQPVDPLTIAGRVDYLDEAEIATWYPLNGHSAGIASYIETLKGFTDRRVRLVEGLQLVRDAEMPTANGSACSGRSGSPDPGASVLDDLTEFIARYVCFPSTAALHAVALWAAHCHVVDAFESTPRLAILSPEPGSGKTRVLEVLELVVPRPMSALSASAPAIFRSIEAKSPTLLFDEVDSIFGRHGKGDESEDLRGLLNAGHRKGKTIPRCVGPAHDVRDFPVFAPAALAGLGDLPETLMSRSVIVRMRRRGPGESVQPFRRRTAEGPGLELADRLSDWGSSIETALAGAWPEMPDGVTDRAADVWEALLAVADAAGGSWPARARDACEELCKTNLSREASLGVRLLLDLRSVFGAEDHKSTEAILIALHALDESPWADLRGKPLDARGLARRLGQYEIESKKVRFGEKTLQGYTREDLWDAWERYCPPSEEAEQAEQAEQVPDVPHVPDTGGAE